MKPLREIHYVMGTLLDLTLFYEDRERGRRILRSLFQEARRLEDLFSPHDEESAVNRLNRKAGLGPVEVEEDLFRLLTLSLHLSRKTKGAFDITIGTLLDLWKEAAKRGRSPDQQAISPALTVVGVAGIRLLSGRRVELSRKGMRLDLGGIGKGYTVDRLRKLLIEEGVERAFLNFGLSSLSTLGPSPSAGGWPILIQGFKDGEVAGLLTLKDEVLSVSGTFGRFFEIEGKRYGHLLDPRNGFPLEKEALGLALAPTATEAEALSSALLVLGPEEGLRMIQTFPASEGLYLTPDRTIRITPGIGTLVPFEAEEGWRVERL